MARPRTLDEIKDGIRDRIGKRAPFIHADRQEAEQALARLNGIDPESWAGAWNEIAERWEEKAREAEAAGNSGRACELS